MNYYSSWSSDCRVPMLRRIKTHCSSHNRFGLQIPPVCILRHIVSRPTVYTSSSPKTTFVVQAQASTLRAVQVFLLHYNMVYSACAAHAKHMRYRDGIKREAVGLSRPPMPVVSIPLPVFDPKPSK
jgi:hypothetical protein